MPRQDLIQIRRGTAAQWTSADPTLADGEFGLETDTNKLKCGDGSTAWTSLDYISGGTDGVYTTTVIIDTTTAFDGSQKGAFNIYRFNKTTAQTVEIDPTDYSTDDVIFIERGELGGTVEITAPSGVTHSGVRDVENRYFINDTNSLVGARKLSTGKMEIFGNLTRGYTGAVTTSSYSGLGEGETGKSVTVLGSGFSDNMVVSVSANATLNSFAVVSALELTLNLDAVGLENDTITVTYDNGDTFVDTDAITIGAAPNAYLTDMVASWQFESNLADYLGVHTLTDAGADIGYSAAKVNNGIDFGGSTSQLTLADTDDFSFIDGGGDLPFTVMFWFKLDTIASRVPLFLNKRDAAANLEWQVNYTDSTDTLAFRLFVDGSNYITHSYSSAGLSTATWYHLAFTYDGSETTGGTTMYLNKVSVGSAVETGTYTGMVNGAGVLGVGAQAWATASTTNRLDGSMDEIHVWKNRELNSTEVGNIYDDEVAGISIL